MGSFDWLVMKLYLQSSGLQNTRCTVTQDLPWWHLRLRHQDLSLWWAERRWVVSILL